MKHGEKIAPIAAAVTGLATLTCCLPASIAAAALAASLSTVIAPYQGWLLAASVVLLIAGMFQFRQAGRTCAPRGRSSQIVFGVCAGIVGLVLFFPEAVAGAIADWLP